MKTADTSANAGGARFIAALCGVPCLAAPFFVFAMNAGYWFSHSLPVAGWLAWLSLPAGAWMGWHCGANRQGKVWKRAGMACWVAAAAMFGYAMEDGEGALWGGLAGLVFGWFYGLYVPWIATVIPARWSVVAFWSCLGALLVVTPLLIAIRLYFGKFDGDDITWVVLATLAGVYFAASRGWWEQGEIETTRLRRILLRYLRRWMDPRLLVWAIAFTVAGMVVGRNQPHYLTHTGDSLEITLAPSSWYWPGCLGAAAVFGLLLSWRSSSTRGSLYRIVCYLMALVQAYTLIGHARFRTMADETRLQLRFGLTGSIEIRREDLHHIEIATARGRRYVANYAILVTQDGKKHSLRTVPLSHEVEAFLRTQWNTTPTE